MTLALTSPTHPTGFSPVSSSNSAIFAEFADEGEREPAAYSPCEGSCELPNARVEMIPALGVRDQFPFPVSLIQKSIGKPFTFEPISTFLRWRCEQPCAFTWIIEIKHFNSPLKTAIQPSSRSQNHIHIIHNHHDISDSLVCRTVKG
jgi:hypothetical protein